MKLEPGTARCECKDRKCPHIVNMPFQQPVQCVLDATRLITVRTPTMEMRKATGNWNALGHEREVALCDTCYNYHHAAEIQRTLERGREQCECGVANCHGEGDCGAEATIVARVLIERTMGGSGDPERDVYVEREALLCDKCAANLTERSAK